MWNIEKIISYGAYDAVYLPEHPNAYRGKYILLHRAIMENHLGRILAPNECVHHINENKKDNRLENLELLHRGDHTSFHMSQKGIIMVKIKCLGCGKIFERRKDLTFLFRPEKSYSVCSAKCSGKFTKNIIRDGWTDEIKKQIQDSVIEIYRKYPKGV